MVTDCFGAQTWDFADAEAVFLQNTYAFLKLIIPGTICFLQWRYYRHASQAKQNLSILSSRQSELIFRSQDRKSEILLFLRLIACISTTILFSDLRLLIFTVVALIVN